MGDIHEYAWEILATIFLLVPFLIALFTSPKEEAIDPLGGEVEPPKSAHGTYRIIPHRTKNVLIIQMHGHQHWQDVDKDGRHCHYGYNPRYSAEYQTERDAEEAIKKWLAIKEEKERLKQEYENNRQAFLAAHPPREVPPFKYVR